MSTQPRYDFITKKFGRQSQPDTGALWLEMKQVLDQHMPEAKKRKRFFWLFSRNTWLLLLFFASLTATGIYLSAAHHRTNTVAGNVRPTAATRQAPQHPVAAQPQSPAPSGHSNETNATTAYALHPITTKPVPFRSGASIKAVALPKEKQPAEKKLNRTIQLRAAHAQPATTGTHLRTTVPAVGALTAAKPLTGTEPGVLSSAVLPSHSHAAIPLQPRIPPAHAYAPATPRKNIVNSVALQQYRGRGFTAGLGLSITLPVGQQQKAPVAFNGKTNPALDYLPSAFVQYHVSRKLFLQTELRLMAPQYVPSFGLYQDYLDATNTQYREEKITLKKLYYLTIPLSVHYNFFPNFNAGAGIEYAYLMRSVFEKESCLWRADAGTWSKAWQTNTMSVQSNPQKEMDLYAAGSSSRTAMDTAAVSLRPHDWRFLLEASYQLKRLQLGLQATAGLQPYINTTQKGYVNTPVKDKSRSVQIYLHYTIFDGRRKF